MIFRCGGTAFPGPAGIGQVYSIAVTLSVGAADKGPIDAVPVVGRKTLACQPVAVLVIIPGIRCGGTLEAGLQQVIAAMLVVDNGSSN